VIHVTKTEKGHPKLYRLDGSDLMQKYEVFEDDGLVLYRSVPTVSYISIQNSSILISIVYSMQAGRFPIIESTKLFKWSFSSRQLTRLLLDCFFQTHLRSVQGNLVWSINISCLKLTIC
jgi:hypothetical protein